MWHINLIYLKHGRFITCFMPRFLLLTPYRETPEHGPNFLDPPPDIIDDEPEWEVERILKQQTFGRWKKKQYLVRWKGYLPAHDSWVNKDDMHANDLLRDFETQHHAIRAGTFRREWQPSLIPFYVHPPMSHNDVPIDISTPSLPPLLTIPHAPERPICQDPIGLSPDSPIGASAATTSGAPPLEPLIPRNRKCSNVPPLELTELNILCQSARQYHMHHGVLPEPLRDPGLFHVINATTTRQYIFANGAGVDPHIYNFKGWSNTLRGLDTTLAPYTHQAFSPTPSPSVTVPPAGNSPYPRPNSSSTWQTAMMPTATKKTWTLITHYRDGKLTTPQTLTITPSVTLMSSGRSNSAATSTTSSKMGSPPSKAAALPIAPSMGTPYTPAPILTLFAPNRTQTSTTCALGCLTPALDSVSLLLASDS
jgi:hypothetical protein